MDGRAMEPLTKDHLRHLGTLAAADREDLFTRLPHRAFHRDRVLCVALCQGAALHWIGGRNGVNDLDVYTFYADGGAMTFPFRRIANAFYRESGLTAWSERVDLLGRSIPHVPGGDPVASVVAYLSKPRTPTARELAKKAVVLVEPSERLGDIIWPVASSRA